MRATSRRSSWTISAHCAVAKPGATLLDSDGRSAGIFGPPAQLADCPVGRFCAPSDFVTLALAPDRIPWGHLNLVDLGAGGYRTIAPGTRPLACPDVNVGDHVEVDGLEHYRSGTVIASGPYEYATDTIFPCMVITEIHAYFGDSGGAVLVNGLPAGTTAREIGGDLAFTPLAEGLENLGLVLCTTPDCDLSPNAEQNVARSGTLPRGSHGPPRCRRGGGGSDSGPPRRLNSAR
jgi:hypothetical protein